jgi:beta-galactosidase beta subunit
VNIRKPGSLTVSAVFSIRKSGIAQLLLSLDNIFDIPVLDSLELGRRSLSLFERYLDFQELLSPEERAKVLGTEGRVTVKLSHGEYTESY